MRLLLPPRQIAELWKSRGGGDRKQYRAEFKGLRRNAGERKGILIGPSMAPRSSRRQRFRRCVFHSLSKTSSRLLAKIRGTQWRADAFLKCAETETRSPARSSFGPTFISLIETGSGCLNNFYAKRVLSIRYFRVRHDRYRMASSFLELVRKVPTGL